MVDASFFASTMGFFTPHLTRFANASNRTGATQMPQSIHAHAAEMHNLAAHAHQAAATAHGKGDHLTAHELSKQAHEHSTNAHKLSEEQAAQATQKK